MTEPYKVTPVFDQDTLPPALRREHSTKEGVWGVIRVLEGQLRLAFTDGTPKRMLEQGKPGFILPQQLHSVEPAGAMKMQVEFYSELPLPVRADS